MKVRLSERQLATVLAALRYWQQDLAVNEDTGEGPISPDHFHDEITPLSVEEMVWRDRKPTQNVHASRFAAASGGKFWIHLLVSLTPSQGDSHEDPVHQQRRRWFR